MKLRDYVDRIQPQLTALHMDLDGEDELGVIIRIHLHIENSLIRFLEQAAPHPRHLKKSRREFSRLVDLAMLLGLDDGLGGPIALLAKVRNKFAHDLSHKLDEDQILGLANSFKGWLVSPSEDVGREIKASAIKEIIRPVIFRDYASASTIKERFSLIATSLWCAIEMHTMHVAHRKGEL